MIPPQSTYSDVVNSFLHRIASQPKFLPYKDMVRWVIDNLRIVQRKFLTMKNTVIGTFTGNYLSVMYHLPEPKCKYNKQFVEKFMKEHNHALEPIRARRIDQNKYKKEELGKYKVEFLVGPYFLIVFMMCRLFSYPDTHNFIYQWTPLISGVSKGYIFD